LICFFFPSPVLWFFHSFFGLWFFLYCLFRLFYYLRFWNWELNTSYSCSEHLAWSWLLWLPWDGRCGECWSWLGLKGTADQSPCLEPLLSALWCEMPFYRTSLLTVANAWGFVSCQGSPVGPSLAVSGEVCRRWRRKWSIRCQEFVRQILPGHCSAFMLSSSLGRDVDTLGMALSAWSLRCLYVVLVATPDWYRCLRPWKQKFIQLQR
jgi:hypothetical protein